VGKTHLAVSLALKACQAGQSIYFTTMEDLIAKLRKDHEAGNRGRRQGTGSMDPPLAGFSSENQN
jgi:DNA replication protein DnaC